MAVVKRPFISENGFQSTGFTVDTAGNVTVRTITNTYTPPAPAIVPDFNVEETAGAFSWKKDGTAVAGTNPTITVERGKTYSINLNLSSLAFSSISFIIKRITDSWLFSSNFPLLGSILEGDDQERCEL